ncbi:hydroxymethylglutaryl-CoA lyase [Novosphingobium sp. 9U]|uniref:hydroxymethylglutaryl-CoA lyase n=1 Tax=Novosphingobium sp. 9U TaxID=2653158 RepID=UPI0012EF1AB7|nr:hydroxymethylglutaryl-CoA lyase [Novosphingobium sp. 9U]VWX49921.1 Hydroxymethylglutaryl-CoA lyase [Novosphingobium sp. 9U]
MERVYLREVGLRDGLQMVKTDLSTERKIEWIEGAVAAGLTEMEVTSFVPPKTFPIFADAAKVAEFALTVPGLTPSALVLNLRGAADAFASGLRQVSYVLSASEAHSSANARRTSDEAAEEFERIVALRDNLGFKETVTLSCGVATAFGCSLQGYVDEDRVLDLAERVTAAGAAEVLIADTVGYGAPGQVERLFTRLRERLPAQPVAAHFHDTRGMGLANVAAALRAGVRRFDASIGGLGGCPFAPGATGNINFEDAAFMLEAEGFETGVDFDRLLALRRKVETWLPQERFTGAILRAGYKPPVLTA